MTTTSKVRVRGSYIRHFFLIGLLLIFLIGAVGPAVILGPTFVDTLTGRRSVDIGIVIYPLLVIVMVGFAVFVALQTRESWDPIYFRMNSFSRHGSRYSYDRVSRVHLNPDKEYVVLLFKEPLGESRTPGIEIRKDRIEPSLKALVSFFEEHDIEIEQTTTFLDRDLFETRRELWKEDRE
jgi:hypothetical protein